MASRAQRRVADKAGIKPEVGPEGQALKAPAHWHVDVVVYEYEREGQYVRPVHMHNLVTNDKTLALSYAMTEAQDPTRAPLRERQLEQATWCDDEKHLDTTVKGLIGG